MKPAPPEIKIFKIDVSPLDTKPQSTLVWQPYKSEDSETYYGQCNKNKNDGWIDRTWETTNNGGSTINNSGSDIGADFSTVTEENAVVRDGQIAPSLLWRSK